MGPLHCYKVADFRHSFLVRCETFPFLRLVIYFHSLQNVRCWWERLDWHRRDDENCKVNILHDRTSDSVPGEESEGDIQEDGQVSVTQYMIYISQYDRQVTLTQYITLISQHERQISISTQILSIILYKIYLNQWD